jgi:hypothetical protein
MKLKEIEETDRLHYRIPVSIKTELDELAERCNKERPKIDFIGALSEGLRGVAKAIRQELDNRAAARGAKNGASVAPESRAESTPNGELK